MSRDRVLHRSFRQIGLFESVLRLSEQQVAIVEAVRRNAVDIQVSARAGSGKTTTILAAAKVAQGKIAICAFNKVIAAEIQSKAPSHVAVQTMHAMGMRCLRQQYANVKVDPDYVFANISQMLEPEERKIAYPVKKLVSLVKNNFALNPTDECLEAMCDEYNVELAPENFPRAFELTRRVLKVGHPKDGETSITIDFDDMIYLPPFLKLGRVPRYDWLFIDEAQDLNAAQMHLMKMIAGKGRICFVGDPFQAMYAWRGSDENAMPTLCRELEKQGRTVLTFPLTITRRCPASVVRFANRYVKDFHCAPNATEGIVRISEQANAKIGDMVLCRRNAPLVHPAFILLRKGVAVKIQGRDIGTGIQSLIKKLKVDTIVRLQERLKEFRIKEAETLRQRYKLQPSRLETAMQLLDDKVETVQALAMDQNTVDGLLSFIDSIFADVDDVRDLVLFSSVHKAKGTEAPRVWLLDCQPCQSSQENNIRYVAITRAMQELIVVHPPLHDTTRRRWIQNPLVSLKDESPIAASSLVPEKPVFN